METQAAYRLLAHEHVEWEAVLAPHWDCSIERMRHHPCVLCMHDSTELDFTTQPGIAGLGPLSYLRQQGLYVHPTLAVTPDGVPLGVLDVWFRTRARATFGEARGFHLGPGQGEFRPELSESQTVTAPID